jgi:hypothetical protein
VPAARPSELIAFTPASTMTVPGRSALTTRVSTVWAQWSGVALPSLTWLAS